MPVMFLHSSSKPDLSFPVSPRLVYRALIYFRSLQKDTYKNMWGLLHIVFSLIICTFVNCETNDNKQKSVAEIEKKLEDVLNIMEQQQLTITNLQKNQIRLVDDVFHLKKKNDILFLENKRIQSLVHGTYSLRQNCCQQQNRTKETGDRRLRTRVTDNLLKNAHPCIGKSTNCNKKRIIKKEEMKTDVDLRKRLLGSVSTDNVVAFSVALSQHLTLGPNQAVQYNEIITNFGNAYDSSHGHMITPVKGMYIIAVTCFNQAQDTDRLELVKNGNLITSFYTQGDNRYAPMSQTVVVSLEKGDVVWSSSIIVVMAFLTWIHWLAILHIVRYGWANSTNCDFDKRCRCSLRNDLLNVDCSNSGKIAVPTVPTNVYTFNVSHNDILLIRNGTFKNLSYLVTLDLSSNRLKTIEPDAFIGLHSLKQFILQNNKLRYHRSVFPTNIFRPLVSLQSLNVQSNSLKYNHTFPDDIISDIVTLESLYVDAIFVTRVLSFGKGYSLLKKLTKLFLGNCLLNEINKNTFVNVPYLEHLQISRCSIRVYNPSALQNLFRMKILNLSYNKLDFNGFSNLVEDTEKMKFLETLILTNTFSTQMNLPKLLFYYLDATNIRELYLNENFFVNATPEVEHIERLPDTLQYLDFSNNKLIDCRFDMPTLKQINMQHNLLGSFLTFESYPRAKLAARHPYNGFHFYDCENELA
ncbi:unnamed protein product [Mytilus edulis]|uniref:C1q domain-containing protein n=1 Tax=Mytilus edulis TaxID=6550 RepID=A0A8S3PWD5_MYTED|nr:unnamed protein product [Mytilus edulis]